MQREVDVTKAHEQKILALALDYDQRFLFSGSKDGVIKTWDTLKPFAYHEALSMVDEFFDAHKSSSFPLSQGSVFSTMVRLSISLRFSFPF